MTTVIPVALMIFINWLVLSRTMSISPLQFLRHDLSRHANRKHALPPAVGHCRFLDGSAPA